MATAKKQLIDIRLALKDRDRDAIDQLRCSAAWPSASPVTPSASNGSAGGRSSSLDERAHSFGAFDGARAVGAVCLHILREGSAAGAAQGLGMEGFSHYHPHRTGAVTGFVMTPHTAKDPQLVSDLFRQVLCVAYLHQLEFVCGAFDDSWVPSMQSLGWRPYAALTEQQDADARIPLCYVLSDLAHLRSVGSPYTPLAAAFGRNQLAAGFFRRLQASNLGLVAAEREAENQWVEFR